ncbi:MAG: type IV toxin-antitoxin system AbiEi family antitoxin domain-containing protein [bacterium]
MPKPKAKNREERLYTLAESQGGYFTSADAMSAGYSHPLQHFHVRRGNWDRVERGIYRLKRFPRVDHEDLIRWWLWSQKKGTISYEAAAEMYDLGDILPSQAHLTVPLNFRKKAVKGLVLHRANLEPGDIEKRDGLPVTTPLRTILDLAQQHLDPERLTIVVKDAIHNGMVDRKALLSILERAPKWLDPSTQVTLQLAIKEPS